MLNLTIPEQEDLLGFFGQAPVEYEEKGAVQSYEMEGPAGILLRFSFNAFEDAVSIRLFAGSRTPLVVVSQEGATELYIDKDFLYVKFSQGSYASDLRLRKSGARWVALDWSTLEVS